MGESIKVTIRLPEDLLESIKAREDSPSEGIRKVLTREYMDLPEHNKQSDSLVSAVVSRATREAIARVDGFTLPVGDVICRDTNPQTQLWWCPEERLAQVKALADVWETGGFKFVVGKVGNGTWYVPEVIEEPEQERRKNGRFSPSCRGMEAHVGDKLIWLEIRDPAKALTFMDTHTDIPCAVRCDVHKYSDDVTYKEAFEKANELFIYYANNGRNRRRDSDPMTQSEFCEMYDV